MGIPDVKKQREIRFLIQNNSSPLPPSRHTPKKGKDVSMRGVGGQTWCSSEESRNRSEERLMSDPKHHVHTFSRTWGRRSRGSPKCNRTVGSDSKVPTCRQDRLEKNGNIDELTRECKEESGVRSTKVSKTWSTDEILEKRCYLNFPTLKLQSGRLKFKVTLLSSLQRRSRDVRPNLRPFYYLYIPGFVRISLKVS